MSVKTWPEKIPLRWSSDVHHFVCAKQMWKNSAVLFNYKRGKLFTKLSVCPSSPSPHPPFPSIEHRLFLWYLYTSMQDCLLIILITRSFQLPFSPSESTLSPYRVIFRIKSRGWRVPRVSNHKRAIVLLIYATCRPHESGEKREKLIIFLGCYEDVSVFSQEI